VTPTVDHEVRAALTTNPERPPSETFGDLSTEAWFWANTEGLRTIPALAARLPGLPPEETQVRFTGASGDETLREAFDAYTLFLDLYGRHASRQLESVLDFGCGWGRVIRFFLRDVPSENLVGIDIDETALSICRETNRFCRFAGCDFFPPTSFEPASFDLIYAYSVFSHLSESSHLGWLAEFQRLLAPGGLLIATTFPREYIRRVAELRASGADTRAWPGVSSFPDTRPALAVYDSGDFCYSTFEGSGVHFGSACVSEQYVRRVWPAWLSPCDYVADAKVCAQNVIVARRH
jgi:SAM-dependent methyltransferase